MARSCYLEFSTLWKHIAYTESRGGGGGLRRGGERGGQTYTHTTKNRNLGLRSIAALSRLLRRWSSPPLLLHRRCRFFYRALSFSLSQSPIVQSLRALVPQSFQGNRGRRQKGRRFVLQRPTDRWDVFSLSNKVSFFLLLIRFFFSLSSFILSSSISWPAFGSVLAWNTHFTSTDHHSPSRHTDVKVGRQTASFRAESVAIAAEWRTTLNL